MFSIDAIFGVVGRFVSVAAAILFLSLSADGADKKGGAVTNDYSSLERANFRFDTGTVNEYLENNAFRDPAKMNAAERFRYDYYTRDWGAVKKAFDDIGDYHGGVIYGRILEEVTNGDKPCMTLDDIMGLLGVCPVKPKLDWLKKLGNIAKVSVLPEERSAFAARLRKGTGFFGGKDKAARIRAGQVLMYAGFNRQASEFLPSAEEAGKLADSEARDAIINFRANVDKANTEEIQRVVKRWNEYATALLSRAPNKDGKAFHELTQMIGHGVPYDKVTTLIRDISEKSGKLAGDFAMLVVKKIANDRGYSDDRSMRTRNLELAGVMVQSISSWTNINVRPWSMIADSMADVWLLEAERSVQEIPQYERGSGRGRWERFITADDMLATIPDGVWFNALSPERKKRIKFYRAKLTMYSSDYEKSVDMIVELAKSNPDAAAVIAREYLDRWAALHSPELPPMALRRYRLKRGSMIIVTPIMAGRNVKSLAGMLKIMRERGIAPDDSESLMKAFTMCYGVGEIYKRKHIEQVFGKPEDINEELFSMLVNDMAKGLGGRWRSAAMKKSEINPAGRNSPLKMLREGYAEAIAMVDQWSRKHPDGWRPLTLAGDILNDWADFEYFQQMDTVSDDERLQLFNEKNAQAYTYFKRGTEAYARAVGSLSPASYSAQAYSDWFNSLLGLNMSGEINISKPMNRAALEDIRTALYGLPTKISQAHIKLFTRDLNKVMNDKNHPIPSELRYKYASSALIIIRKTPFGTDLDQQDKYYNQLLDEARLVARIDGDNVVCRDGEFGLIISLAHSAALGSQLNIAQYITPQQDFVPNGRIRKMRIANNVRNEFEAEIYARLSPFFRIKSVTFSDKDVMPRDTEKPDWQETVLAYVVLQPLGVSVDRIPELELKLNFLDKSGPVTLPVVSAETMLKVHSSGCGPRPYDSIKLKQTLDTRRLYRDGILSLDVSAVGRGLMPELNELVDVAALSNRLAIVRVAGADSATVKRVDSWSEKVGVESSRDWKIVFDCEKILRHPDVPWTFEYPSARDTNTIVVNEVYSDEDLVKVENGSVQLVKGDESGSAKSGIFGARGSRRRAAWIWGVILVVAVGSVALWFRRRMSDSTGAVLAQELPSQMDAFVLVHFLRGIESGENLSDERMAELRREIAAIEAKAFGAGSEELSEDEMWKIARRWKRA